MEQPAYKCHNVVTGSKAALNLSRHELIEWINQFLEKKLKSVEELCSGAIYCKFMDLLFPGCIPLKKIRFTAHQQHEYISNYKWLQVAFCKVGCDKHVPIDRLIKGRFQENFEFLQWFKRFYDANTASVPIITTTCLIKTMGYPEVAFTSESSSYSSRTPARVLRSQTSSSVFSSQALSSVFPSQNSSRVPKVPCSHVKPKVISSDGPSTNVKLRGPSTNVKLRGPSTNVKLRGPSTDVKLRGPSTDVKLRGPSTDAKRRGPSTDAKRRGTSTDAKRRRTSTDAKRRGSSTEAQIKIIGAKTQLCSPGVSTHSAAASLARQKEEENELKTKIAQLEELNEELKRKNELYYLKLKKIELLCTKQTQDADVEMNKDELISRILAELQTTQEDYGPEVEEDDHATN